MIRRETCPDCEGDGCPECDGVGFVGRPFVERWEICERCEGEGRHVHEALRCWTQEDIRDDPDGFQTMMGGGFDVPCRECRGSGKVKIRIEVEE